jgi:molybdopterin-guanine dinucleotide biosynthesis protein A
MTSSVAAIILAGGSSRRMGRDKALLPMPGREHVPFITQLSELLATFCHDVVLVTRDAHQAATYTEYLATQEASPVRIVSDQVPSVGPLMGLYSGLSTLDASHALVTAVDMPFVQPALLSFLLAFPLNNALLVPIVDTIPQVLLAIYPRSILPLLATSLQHGRRDLRCLLDLAPAQHMPVHYIDEAQLRTVDPQLRSFVNINTPAQYHDENGDHD